MDALTPVGDLDPADLPSDEEYAARIYAAVADPLADLREEIRALRDTLALAVLIPVEQRDPQMVAVLEQTATDLALDVIDVRDPEIVALSSECGNLALTAIRQRLQYEAEQA